MKKLIQESEAKWFHCGCRDWRYMPDKDFTKDPQPKDEKIHDCPRMTVYQRKLSRVFIKKQKETTLEL